MVRLADLDEMELVEHRLALMRAYDKACADYDQPKAAALHASALEALHEITRRRGDDSVKTGLEALSIDELIALFVQRAIAYDEADGMPEVDDRYWDLDKVSVELERRDGDQRRVLFRLYFHPDERVHHAAAEATRTLAPALSLDRKNSVGDEDWQPPAAGNGAYEAQLHGLVSEETRSVPRLAELDDLTDEQLVERFLTLSIEQDEAERHDELARYNRLFSRERAVIDELKRRGGDKRRILARFYDHANIKVRLNAAHATLALMPEEARKVFEIISQSGGQPYCANAAGTLRSLDEGFYKPT
jgi:hypothetical protein